MINFLIAAVVGGGIAWLLASDHKSSNQPSAPSTPDNSKLLPPVPNPFPDIKPDVKPNVIPIPPLPSSDPNADLLKQARDIIAQAMANPQPIAIQRLREIADQLDAVGNSAQANVLRTTANQMETMANMMGNH